MSSNPEWMNEAAEKGLPEVWVETLAASDGFTEQQKAVFVQHVDNAEDLAAKRVKAVEIGRLLGADEAGKRRETGSDREQRIRRAMAYAAWKFDGKPLSSLAQSKEFGVETAIVVGSLDRILHPVVKKER
jgi:hypothetical protein